MKAEPLEEELSGDIEEDPSQEESAAIEAADGELQEAAEEILSEVFSEEAQGAAGQDSQKRRKELTAIYWKKFLNQQKRSFGMRSLWKRIWILLKNHGMERR